MKAFKDLTYSKHNFIFPVKHIPLYAMLSGCGYQRETSNDYYWNGMNRGRREFAIWQYTVSGCGMLEYNGKTMQVPPGTAMMLHIPHNHSYYLAEHSAHWEFIYINFTGREFLRIWDELNRIVGPLTEIKQDSPVIQTALKICKSAESEILTSPTMASSYAYQMVMSIADELLPQKQHVTHTPKNIIRAINYCMEHLSEPLTVDDLAGISGYSRYHFSRLFKLHQGMSPAHFLRNLRLQHAVRLLQSEMLSVKEIATKCGFDNDNYFCKVFRQAFGTSPNVYRNGGKK